MTDFVLENVEYCSTKFEYQDYSKQHFLQKINIFMKLCQINVQKDSSFQILHYILKRARDK